MRILLLAHALRGQGGFLRGRGFISSLASAAPQHEYLITVPAGCGYEEVVLPKGSKFYFCENKDSNTNLLARFRMEVREIPALQKTFNADVIFGMGNHGLPNVKCPQAIWNGNAYLVYPSKHFPFASIKERMQTKYQRFHFRQTLKCTDLLFCQTPVMRQRISDYYGYDIKRVKILPNTLSPLLQKPGSNDAVIRPKEITDDKFNCLILSKYYPHKNPEMLLDACLPSYEQLGDIRFITTISEQHNIHSKRFIQRLDKNSHMKKLFQNIGTIAHENLEAYYRNVQLVIMPTLMESFSVTYLEAMYFGVPILTTDLDFAHYLCGNAAAYYDPWQPKSFVGKLLMLKSNASACEKLEQAGYEQLRKFSATWDDIVKSAISQVESLIG